MIIMATKLKQVFRMKEGTGETSYAKASYIQKQVLSLTKSIKEKALRELFKAKEQPTTICIADLGCSSAAQNTLGLISNFIDTIKKAHRRLGDNQKICQEYQVYLNDLPANDFNTLFRALGDFEEKLKEKRSKEDVFGHCFVNGVPGSFYGRLFPSNKVHFVHSSYSLHWLSQVPEGIEDNKRNIAISRLSPPNVLKAYCDQHENDFSTFLKCRSEEVVAGGMMVLTMIGRTCSELYSKEAYRWVDILAIALNDMVSEGLIEEERLNTFNFPLYCPSATELGYLVEKEGSFTLTQVQISEVNWETTIQDGSSFISYDHNDFAKSVRAVQETFVVNHFGEAVIEEVFNRYNEILKVEIAKEKKNVLINVTIWLTRK